MLRLCAFNFYLNKKYAEYAQVDILKAKPGFHVICIYTW